MKITKMNWFGDKVMREIQAAANRGVNETAKSILNESNAKVPLDTGELRNSGAIDTDQGSQSASISYSAPHAVDVHETPRNYRNGRKHKYLESSINNHADQLATNLKNEFGKALR